LQSILFESSHPRTHMIRRMVLLFSLCLTSIAFSASFTQGALMVKKEAFGTTPDGKAVELYTLTNTHGLEVRVMTYGGIIVSLQTPDKRGKFADITLGFDALAGYLGASPYFGALVGRYGNRIGNGKFTLDGKEYTLAKNNGPNALHGGLKGFDKVVWQAQSFEKGAEVGLILKYTSVDGEEGY